MVVLTGPSSVRESDTLCVFVYPNLGFARAKTEGKTRYFVKWKHSILA